MGLRGMPNDYTASDDGGRPRRNFGQVCFSFGSHKLTFF